MKKIRIAICDDEILLLPRLAATINNYFLKIGMITETATFSASADLLDSLYNGTVYKIFFLDIDIPEQDGISLAERILEIHPDTLIIFVSAKEELILDTFRVRPLAFVRKSHFSGDMEKAMSVALKHLEEPADTVIPFRDELGHDISLNLTRIIYIEAMGKYQKIISIDGEEMLRCSINDLEAALLPYHFVRIHRSFLVNLKYVYRIDSAQILLDSHQFLPLSRHRRKEIQQAFLKYSSARNESRI